MTTPTAPTIDRPGQDEYAPYYEKYVSRVPAGALVDVLAAQAADVLALFGPLTDAQANGAYAPGKWTVKEVLGHLTDTERVMAYRALSFARGDQNPLPGFDENAWTPAGQFTGRTIPDLLDEWVAVRSATIGLLKGLPQESVTRRGVASKNPASVRGLGYIIAGHTIHHADIVRERYVGGAP